MNVETFQYSIRDKGILLAAYMPFVRNGGLFLKGVSLPMGSPVGLFIDVGGEATKYALEGKVTWVNSTPTGTQAGVGVQFLEGPSLPLFKQAVDKLLVGLDRTKHPTYTL